MADDITSQATLSASSTNPSYPLANATDGSTSTLWRCNVGGAGWLMFTLPAAKCITRLDICGATNRIKDFAFQASTDGSAWSNLYTGQNTNDNTLVTHTIPNTASYKYYRIYITSTWGNIDRYYPGISEVKIYAATLPYATSGNATYSISGITGTVNTASISWTESKPTGATLTVSVSTDGTNYSAVTNGGTLLAAGMVLDNATIYIKVEMSTTDTATTPTLSDLTISLQSTADLNSIVLEMQPMERFESAAGDITVAYDGAGTLAGAGGAVEAFIKTFAPAELIPKPDQNDQEHIAITSVTASGTLTAIQYISAKADEHISITGITAVGVLTNINDI